LEGYLSYAVKLESMLKLHLLDFLYVLFSYFRDLWFIFCSIWWQYLYLGYDVVESHIVFIVIDGVFTKGLAKGSSLEVVIGFH